MKMQRLETFYKALKGIEFQGSFCEFNDELGEIVHYAQEPKNNTLLSMPNVVKSQYYGQESVNKKYNNISIINIDKISGDWVEFEILENDFPSYIDVEESKGNMFYITKLELARIIKKGLYSPRGLLQGSVAIYKLEELKAQLVPLDRVIEASEASDKFKFNPLHNYWENITDICKDENKYCLDYTIDLDGLQHYRWFLSDLIKKCKLLKSDGKLAIRALNEIRRVLDENKEEIIFEVQSFNIGFSDLVESDENSFYGYGYITPQGENDDSGLCLYRTRSSLEEALRTEYWDN